MESRCVALKLLLDAVDVPADIRTVADRKRVQKAVYLIQLTGIDLGYQYGWYLMGPYSTALTRDYYALATALAEGDEEAEAQELKDPVRERLSRLKPLMETPQGIAIDQSDWLELVASVHYLEKVRGLSEEAADEELAKLKPAIAPLAFAARAKLEKAALLS